jgi:hypothetical protein
MKKLPIIVIILLSLYALLLTMCSETKTFQSDPITAMGHGAFIGTEGNEIIPTEQFIELVQKFYIEDLLNKDNGHEKIPSVDLEKMRKQISGIAENKILGNALFLDWLIEKIQPANTAHLSAINSGLRWHYVNKIQKNPTFPADQNYLAKGFGDLKAKQFEALGLKIMTSTTEGVAGYCKECLEAGVPIPSKMFGSEWKRVGNISNVFISEGLQAELWIYESETPKGICLALPRFAPGSDRATLFGVICLGTVSSNACFFDNPPTKSFKRNEEIDFKQNFNGGFGLVSNQGKGGVCTDCHAGKNPYVVHPDDTTFMAVINKIQPLGWHKPLVAQTWPHNPGPSNMLLGIESKNKCSSCHNATGSAGQFPIISSELSEYCRVILTTAIGRTMPPSSDPNLRGKRLAMKRKSMPC